MIFPRRLPTIPGATTWRDGKSAIENHCDYADLKYRMFSSAFPPHRDWSPRRHHQSCDLMRALVRSIRAGQSAAKSDDALRSHMAELERQSLLQWMGIEFISFFSALSHIFPIDFCWLGDA